MKKAALSVSLIVCCTLVLLFIAVPAIAGNNSVTFDNQSGEEALVRLVCPSGSVKQITVPNSTKRTIGGIENGSYFIKIRYGTNGNYRYSKGDTFSINAFYPQYIMATITLHPVANGNYGTRPIGAEEFNR